MNEATAKINLKMVILWEISDGPISGYDIIKNLSSKGMKAPSPGSLYPILHDLNNQGLVSFKEDGKKKVYSLTAKGRSFMKKMNNLHKKSVEQMMSQLSTIAGQDDITYYERLNSLSRDYKKEMLSDLDVLGPLQDAIIRVYETKDIKTRKYMRKLLSDTTLKLKRKV
ncbi:MAG: PadR family transcriptional regulator [Candidatus Woesearchaeota archaeon]